MLASLLSTEERILLDAIRRATSRGESKADFLHVIRATEKELASRLWDEYCSIGVRFDCTGGVI